jgi:hypothetical protein
VVAETLGVEVAAETPTPGSRRVDAGEAAQVC